MQIPIRSKQPSSNDFLKCTQLRAWLHGEFQPGFWKKSSWNESGDYMEKVSKLKWNFSSGWKRNVSMRASPNQEVFFVSNQFDFSFLKAYLNIFHARWVDRSKHNVSEQLQTHPLRRVTLSCTNEPAKIITVEYNSGLLALQTVHVSVNPIIGIESEKN